MKAYKFNLKEVRISRGLTQTELANKLGIAQQVISRYERGNFMPQLDNAKIIADALNVTVDELIIIKEAKEIVAKKLKQLEEESKGDLIVPIEKKE